MIDYCYYATDSTVLPTFENHLFKTISVIGYCCYTLNKLTLHPTGPTLFRNSWALSSVLTTLGLLQARALMFLNHVDPSNSLFL